MNKYISILLLLVLICGTTPAQKRSIENPGCGTVPTFSPPAYPAHVDHKYPDYTHMRSANATYIIPVVFHIFHQGGRENLSREQLLGALERVNQDFSAQNPYLDMLPEHFQNFIGNVDIEMRLASIDPNGNCTDGINRIYSPLTDWNFESDVTMREVMHWPADKYLNVYIIDYLYDENGHYFFTGLGQFPWNDTRPDGIVLPDQHMRVDELPLGSLNYSTFAHEIGHWLGLFHIWGDDGLACTGSDEIDDTPNCAGPSYKCFDDYPFVTCGNGPHGNMFSNIMDYGYCPTMFTPGQQQRMYTSINLFPHRNNVVQPVNLTATGTDIVVPPDFSCAQPPIADFANDNRFVSACEDGVVRFYYRSYRALPTSYSWHFPGGNPETDTTKNVEVRFSESGEVEVTLIVFNDFGSDTLSRSVFIHVYEESTTYSGNQMSEDFENFNEISEFGYTCQYYGGELWQLTTDVGYASDQCAALKTYGQPIDNVSVLLTPKFDLSQFSDHAELRFMVAYPEYGLAEVNRLFIDAYTDCATDFFEDDIYLADFSTEDLFSTPASIGGFVPTSDAEWKEMIVDIPSELLGRDDVQFTFALYNVWANNIYIDEIRIVGSVSSVQESKANSGWSIHPNPAKEQVFVELNQFMSEGVLDVYTIHGKRIDEKRISGTSRYIDLNYEPGVYFIQLRNEDEVLGEVKRLVVN